ncbi:hypothetical protein PV11_05387 [Exophiala sideris]|uniref:Uncharacterized protein n=1 Tax=Exophiala sideris TaxID=1016849 RepID=A0A0D1YPZ2_9EURO|nr:hypothetical protein PV11_05387 [Exophiala sideris]
MATFEEDTKPTDATIRAIMDHVGLTDDYRLHIGIDFGTKFSSVCYDYSRPSIPLINCHAASETVKDYNTSDRFASIAAFTQADDVATKTLWQLEFGARALRSTRSTTIGQNRVVKVEMMKLHLISEQYAETLKPRMWHVLNDLNQHHADVMHAICNGGREVSCRVHDPLSQQYRVCSIRSVDCIIREFLLYLLQSTKARIAKRHKLTPAVVTTIFRKKADVAISVPTNEMWTDSIMFDFRYLLQKAGFPEATILVSEARSSALYHAFELIKAAGFDVAEKTAGKITEQITIIADLQVDTTNITCLGSYHATEGSCTISFGEISSGVGSLDGSEMLSTLFKQYLRHELFQLPGGVSGLVPHFQGSQDQILDACAAGFELVKQDFDNTRASYEVAPRFDADRQPRLLHIDQRGIIVDGNQLILDASIIQAIFDEWLTGIASMLRAVILDVTKDWKETTPVVIGLTGWDWYRLPPYVLQFLTAHFSSQRGPVQVIEIKTRLAQGNYLQLVHHDLAGTQSAYHRHLARIGGDEAKIMADLRYSKHGPPRDVRVPPRGPELDPAVRRVV